MAAKLKTWHVRGNSLGAVAALIDFPLASSVVCDTDTKLGGCEDGANGGWRGGVLHAQQRLRKRKGTAHSTEKVVE